MNFLDFEQSWRQFELPSVIAAIFEKSGNLIFPKTREQIFSMAMGGKPSGIFEVAYDIPGRGRTMPCFDTDHFAAP